MTKLTKDQLAFAKSMTIKQRRFLRTMETFPAWFMSASERADPDLYDLVRHKFVQCAAVFGGTLPSWGVTEQGRRIVKRLETTAI